MLLDPPALNVYETVHLAMTNGSKNTSKYEFLLPSYYVANQSRRVWEVRLRRCKHGGQLEGCAQLCVKVHDMLGDQPCFLHAQKVKIRCIGGGHHDAFVSRQHQCAAGKDRASTSRYILQVCTEASMMARQLGDLLAGQRHRRLHQSKKGGPRQHCCLIAPTASF